MGSQKPIDGDSPPITKRGSEHSPPSADSMSQTSRSWFAKSSTSLRATRGVSWWSPIRSAAECSRSPSPNRPSSTRRPSATRSSPILPSRPTETFRPDHSLRWHRNWKRRTAGSRARSRVSSTAPRLAAGSWPRFFPGSSLAPVGTLRMSRRSSNPMVASARCRRSPRRLRDSRNSITISRSHRPSWSRSWNSNPVSARFQRESLPT